MADRKITAHTAITAADVATNDVIEIVDVSDTTDAASGTNKKMTVTEAGKMIRNTSPIDKVSGSTNNRWLPNSDYHNQSTIALTINSLRAAPFPIRSKIIIDRLGIEVTAGTSGKIRIGIFSSGADGNPSSLVVDSGEITITAPGAYSVTVSVTLEPGLYWWAYITDTANTLRSFAAGVNIYHAIGYGPSFGASFVATVAFSALTYTLMPSSFPAISYSNTIQPIIFFRIQ